MSSSSSFSYFNFNFLILFSFISIFVSKPLTAFSTTDSKFFLLLYLRLFSLVSTISYYFVISVFFSSILDYYFLILVCSYFWSYFFSIMCLSKYFLINSYSIDLNCVISAEGSNRRSERFMTSMTSLNYFSISSLNCKSLLAKRHTLSVEFKWWGALILSLSSGMLSNTSWTSTL